MTALSETAYVTTRHLRYMWRQPWFVMMALVQPIIWLLLFGALFKNVVEIPGFSTSATYLDYLVPGVLVMTALFSCGWSGMSIIEDLDRSIMDRFLIDAHPPQRPHRRAERLRAGRPCASRRDHRRRWRGCSGRIRGRRCSGSRR